MRIVEITELKNISKMRFEIPGEGVYLLCGTNGVGKSTLLACLLRIGSPNAFASFFRTSSVSDRLDQFDAARVKYFLNEQEVVYSYGGQRWTPQPKRHAGLLKRFGYPAVVYAGANAARIEPRPEDFNPRRVRDVPALLKEAAVRILGEKFRDLKRINVKRGTGSEAFLLVDRTPPSTAKAKAVYYFSERNFSLGEICVLKLLRQLLASPSKSLVLIDELELALHPSAQISLLKFLEELSIEKKLTVIFSTHSVGLIRTVKRSQVLLLSKGAGGVLCTRGAYAAQAIGLLGASADAAPDRALFVEDDLARWIVEAALRRIVTDHVKEGLIPTAAVQPIGGFPNVVRFLTTASSFLSPSTKYFALLDKDVEEESLREAGLRNSHEFLAQVKTIEHKLKFLPWTPEVGIVKRFAEKQEASEASLRVLLGDGRFSLDGSIATSIVGLEKGPLRAKCKSILATIVKSIRELKGWSDGESIRLIAQWFATSELDDRESRAVLTGLLLPLIK